MPKNNLTNAGSCPACESDNVEEMIDHEDLESEGMVLECQDCFYQWSEDYSWSENSSDGWE